MLSKHRSHASDEVICIIMTPQIQGQVQGQVQGHTSAIEYNITHNKGLELPNSYYDRNRIKIIRWYLRSLRATPILTPLNSIRRVLTYTEPKYMPWMEHYLNIHENQYNAAKEIIDYYECGCRDVILAAEMQSGKSGTIRYLIHHMLHVSANVNEKSEEWEQALRPDNIYFICGMNDNDLRSQACQEFKGLLNSNNIMFSKQLQKWNQNGDPNTVSAVIVDESHYAGQVFSQVDKFFQRLKKRSVKWQPLVLSVSATPMAEIAAIKQDKGIVYLKPGPNYYGISDLFNAGLIYQSINITENMQAFLDLVCKEYEFQTERSMKKYNIVRLPSQWYYQDLEDSIKGLDLDVSFINHHSQSQLDMIDFNQLTTEEPDRFTIIWIYGTLRAGKQLDTSNIGFVHDTSQSRPDTIAQSLMGRILGYGKAGHHVKCFTDLESANLVRIWFSNMFDATRIPRKSCAILNGYSDVAIKWALHPSIGVRLDKDLAAHYRCLKQEHGNRYPYKWDFFADILACADGTIKPELTKILGEYTIGPSGGLMILTETNAPRSFAEHWISNYYYHLKNRPVRGFDVESADVEETGARAFYHVYANLNINSLQYGYVLICYKEYIDGEMGREHIQVSSKSRYK